MSMCNNAIVSASLHPTHDLDTCTIKLHVYIKNANISDVPDQQQRISIDYNL